MTRSFVPRRSQRLFQMNLWSNEGAALREAGAKFSKVGRPPLHLAALLSRLLSFSRLAGHVHVDSWLLFAPKYISADGVSSSGILAPSMVALCARCKSPRFAFTTTCL